MSTEEERKIEEEIEQARSELTSVVLAKQREVVRRMGEALEKIRKGKQRRSICAELKDRLRNEIQRELISEKTIENYSKPEWKNAAKSKAGRMGAENRNTDVSAEKISAELPEQQPIVVTNDGSVLGEPQLPDAVKEQQFVYRNIDRFDDTFNAMLKLSERLDLPARKNDMQVGDEDYRLALQKKWMEILRDIGMEHYPELRKWAGSLQQFVDYGEHIMEMLRLVLPLVRNEIKNRESNPR